MRKGFPKVALGAVSAALLSGSVLAVGPTIDGIPNIVITDRVSSPTANPPGNVYDVNTNETLNIYRFTDAIVLEDYVTADGNKSLVNFLFTESDLDSTLRTGAAQTLEIGVGEPPVYRTGESTAVPSANDINTIGTDVVAAGALDFRNFVRTTDFATGSAGTLPTFTDEALITVFVSDAASGEVDSDSFIVLTTNDPAYDFDTFSSASVASTIFTPVVCYDNFDSWYAVGLTSFIRPGQFPAFGWLASSTNPGFFADATNVPVNSANASPADVLRVTSQGNPGTGTDIALAAAQVGFWQSYQDSPNGTIGGRPADTTIPVTAGSLYMIRWGFQTSATAGTRANYEAMRFRVGDPGGVSGIGNMTDEFNRGVNYPDGVSTHRSWFYANASGDMTFNVDNIDLTTDDAGSDIRLDTIEVFSTTRAALGTGTVLYNAGTANGGLTLAAGVPAPPTDNYAGFATANWNFSADLGPTFRPVNNTGSGANARVIDFPAPGASTGNNIGTWLSATADPDVALVSAVPNAALLALDVYYNSPNGATANNRIPDGRIGLAAQTKGETGQPGGDNQGRSAFFNWANWNRTDVPSDVTGQFRSFPLAAETANKRVSLFIEPQLRAGSTADFDVYLQLLAFDSLYPTSSGGTPIATPSYTGTLNVTRVVVTQYGLPADAATVTVPTCN